MSLPNTVLAKLNVVLVALHDSQQAYQTCARETKDLELQAWLGDLANKRSNMALDMEHLLANFGLQPTNHGSFPGAIQRLWVNVKSMVTELTKEGLLPDIKRSEGALIQTYHEILAEPGLPSPLMNLLNHQLGEIRSELTALERNEHQPSMGAVISTESSVRTEAVIDATNQASFPASDAPEFIQPKESVAPSEATTRIGSEAIHDAGLTDQEVAGARTKPSQVQEALRQPSNIT